MSTTSLTAGDVMDRAAVLMNDPAKTDYTYAAQLPYLNMAIDELVEHMDESNSSPSNLTTDVPIILLKGQSKITWTEHPDLPHYPPNLVEIQEVLERAKGSLDAFLPLERKEWLQGFPPSNSLLFWVWENQMIKFNPNGALGDREILLRYIRATLYNATSEATEIPIISSKSYLAYKTAALCSQFIGENETRAGILDMKAEQALERVIGISNKGRQQIMTRHRPFRAGYKSRGGF